MNKMYEYLEEHAYISKNKKSNYQFELSKARAECIANKYNSLCEEKDKEIERLNKECDAYMKIATKKDNIINELEKYFNEQIQKSWEIEEQCYENIESKLQELKGSDK